MSSNDLISFLGDASPQATAPPPKAAEPENSLASELLSFDPLTASTVDAKAPPVAPPKGVGLPDAIAAAFAKANQAEATPHATGAAELLVGTWNFKKDSSALKEYDVQSIVEATEDGGVRLVEFQEDGGQATGLLEASGEWFQANLQLGSKPYGVARLRRNGTGDVCRDFKSSATAAWEGETVGHMGFNKKEAAELMSLGVGEDAARYREQRAREE